MERVLIVSKTRMNSGVCVSGVTSSNRSIRLIPQGRHNQTDNTMYEIGQVWEIDFTEAYNAVPPHTEDVFVRRQRYVKTVSNIRETLLKIVQPWQGGPEQLFDQTLTIENTKCFISESGLIPTRSTGYWIPEQSLVLDQSTGKPYYTMDAIVNENGKFFQKPISIKFVGIVPPIHKIPRKTLVRVSLARWFQPTSVTEQRCYLQVSGWYL